MIAYNPFRKLLEAIRRFWFRYRLGKWLREWLHTVLLDAVRAGMEKSGLSAASMKKSIRQSIKQAMQKANVPESVSGWIVDPLLDQLDIYVDQYFGDQKRILDLVDSHLKKLLGI